MDLGPEGPMSDKKYSPYFEMLRDPRWQKKRLEILQRDNFTCVECHSDGKHLNVHHGYYAKGKKPWEYPDASLYTLCEDCHRAISATKTILDSECGLVAPILYPYWIGLFQSFRAQNDTFDVVPLGYFHFLGLIEGFESQTSKDGGLANEMRDHFDAMQKFSIRDAYEWYQAGRAQ